MCEWDYSTGGCKGFLVLADDPTSVQWCHGSIAAPTNVDSGISVELCRRACESDDL